MKQLFDFEEIRPFYDEEVPAVIQALLQEEGFQHAVKYVMPGVDYEAFSKQMSEFSNKRDFQKKLIIPFLIELARKSSSGLDASGFENVTRTGSYTYISNHRDIVLDASFLNTMLDKNGIETSEVAIGDNLLIYPWISDLVRLNKSFVVKRDVTVRKMLEVSRRLSNYIHFTIKIKHRSVWIAQREGRAKDSNDHTQESLLKMLSLGGAEDLKHNIIGLNIVPVSISYEYDPCDYLKAREFLLKRDNPEYKKTPHDDLLNMETGMLGYKGLIHFQLTPCISEQLEKLPDTNDKAETITKIAHLIDQAIHSNYRIYSGNYVAYDILHEGNAFANKYTEEEKIKFLNYINQQIDKINDIPDKDSEFLRSKMLEMYCNPLKNKLIALSQKDVECNSNQRL